MPVTRTTTTTSVLEIRDDQGAPKLTCRRLPDRTFELRVVEGTLGLTTSEALELSNYIREETSPPPHPRESRADRDRDSSP